MVTLDSKVDQVFTDISYNFESMDDVTETRIKEIIRWAIKQQDRDTRHACAECINMTDIAVAEPEMKALVMRMKNIFHSAVVNCRGELKEV